MIKDWLRFAKDREGGRKKRELDKKPQHMWFFQLFKRNAQFLEGMFNTCNGMDTDVSKRVMEVAMHVIDDRQVKKL